MDNVIFSYTRKQAIEDGVLIDITRKARDFGFRVPVAITASLHGLITPPKGLADQDYDGRLADVLVMAYLTAVRARGRTDISFPCLFRDGDGEDSMVRETVHANIGPGDDGEPVLTLMLAEDL